MSAHSKNAADEYETLPIGKVSPLQEDDAHYYAVTVMKKGKDRLKLATIAWLKEPLQSWVTRAETQVQMTLVAVSANYTLPLISSPSVACTDDTWTPTSLTNVPAARSLHTAVWTGSEMIVWGGIDQFGYSRSGGRYNPTSDTWLGTSFTNAPSARWGHTAVWTGSEMIVWGGYSIPGGDVNTGGRYNPTTDSWTATTTTNAPDGRDRHTAVWTGSEMIVWGGTQNNGITQLNTGGRYNVGTDSWTATTVINAPNARFLHTGIWSGNEMIVWGGVDENLFYLDTGGRYSPGTGSWTVTSITNAPSERGAHTAIWTGNEMIVWGGYPRVVTGGRYNPGTDTWTATSTTNAPPGRDYHTAVWTGSEMIV
jgi:N-acetylneuraminic acid mutarotase